MNQSSRRKVRALFADPVYVRNRLYEELSSRKDTGFKTFLVNLQQKAVKTLIRRNPAMMSAIGPLPRS